MTMSKNWGPGDSEIDVDEWWRLCCERRECKWLSNWATKAYKLDHSLPEHCSALLMTMMLTKKGRGKGSQVCAQLVAAQTRPQLQLLSHLWPHHLPSPMSKHLLFYHSDADYFNSPELCPEPFVNEDDEEEEWQRDEKSHLVQGVLLLPMEPLKNCEIWFLKITKNIEHRESLVIWALTKINTNVSSNPDGDANLQDCGSELGLLSISCSWIQDTCLWQLGEEKWITDETLKALMTFINSFVSRFDLFLRNSASSFHWLSSSIFTVCSLFGNTSSHDVLDHTNHIFSVRIWSWQHVSVIF